MKIQLINPSSNKICEVNKNSLEHIRMVRDAFLTEGGNEEIVAFYNEKIAKTIDKAYEKAFKKLKKEL